MRRLGYRIGFVLLAACATRALFTGDTPWLWVGVGMLFVGTAIVVGQ